MFSLLVAAGCFVAARPLSAGLGRLARTYSPALRPAAPRPADVAALVAGAASLALLTGGIGGDLLVAGVAAAAVTARRSPWSAVPLVVAAAVGALRVGSAGIADVAGAHEVLGPALLASGLTGWAAALAALAAWGSAAAVMPVRQGAGRLGLPSPGVAVDALAPLLAVLVAVMVAAGPPAHSLDLTWIGPRLAAAAGLAVGAALVRRALPYAAARGIERAAGLVALAAFALALAGR